ncbi:DUF6265 family protein [Polaribacter sargassicola]|uniref:DUF6265 family protein n=1 Tax=Polaribacter sargassicola TaxID=2836891 RepID=UPI001F428B80|nr:DUF6265 family protein [Polaribacter sp. DS7-9]MCG1035917.1 hypothetical protein [Polaribacter sp. DS7-9]
MKLVLLIFCSFLIISCSNKKENIKQPDFLTGNWIRTNDKDSVKTYEIWQKNLTGIGFSLKGKDTIFFEKMDIVNIKDTLFLKVDGPNEEPTFFKFINQTDSSFVCVNTLNEFPKKIKYYKENNQLKAIISNDDFKIDFVFEKIKH